MQGFQRILDAVDDRGLAGVKLPMHRLALLPAGPDTTWPDVFARHNAPWADLLFAAPYAAFVYVAAALGVMLWFRDRRRVQVLVWAIALMYVLAMLIWIVQPTAPPWYVRTYGCAIDPAAAPSAAALARVDALLGISYFGQWYGGNPNSFGALPSLHNGFAMLGDRKSTRLNSSHIPLSRMPSSA